MQSHFHAQSSITCSGCGHTATETMPVDACVCLYECKNCKKLMTPDAGDCCIFCSKGTQPCPTSQRERLAYAVIAPGSHAADSVSLNAAQAS